MTDFKRAEITFRANELLAVAQGCLYRTRYEPIGREVLRAEHALREALQIIETLKGEENGQGN